VCIHNNIIDFLIRLIYNIKKGESRLYRTQKCQIRGLKKREYLALRELCKLSKNMYNETLYVIRQYFFQEGQWLRYESAYHILKCSENYKLLPADVAQQMMRVVDRNFKSFFALLKKIKKDGYRFQEVRLPKYKKQNELFSLILPNFNIKNGYLILQMSHKFKKEFGEVKIKFPSNLEEGNIKSIRIIPKFAGKYFEIEYVHEVEVKEVKLDSNKFLGIDLGLDNLATCVTSTGASFIIDGKKLKSINQWWNKENARLQSIKDLQGIKHLTNNQFLITRKRNNRVNYYMNKAVKIIVDYCIENQIGNIVVGYNVDMKRSINIGRQNNQNFVQIPHGVFRQKLQSRCGIFGIKYVEQEESYTSKADFFSDDELPIWNADNPIEKAFSGRRISKGQYRSATGIILNADVNGALNILRKSNLIDLRVLQSRGCFNQPTRIRINSDLAAILTPCG